MKHLWMIEEQVGYGKWELRPELKPFPTRDKGRAYARMVNSYRKWVKNKHRVAKYVRQPGYKHG